ncbi:hypothetical protein ACKVMT_11455 [Halobacteriales archaeon Cl-PHB]
MSSDGAIDALEIEDSGFVVTKQLSGDNGGHIQVDLEIESTHDDQATVDVVEQVPAGTSQSQVGFMPNHEPSEWDVTDDGKLVLQARLMGEGSRQIIYGLRDIDPDEAEPLASEPRVIAVGGPVGDAIDVDADVQPATAAAAAGVEAEADGGASEDASDDPAPVAEEPNTTANPPAAEEPATTDDAALEVPLDDETAAQLAEQLEPHLDGGGTTDAVTETKLTQLQEDVGEVRTYLPALEEFLGETGRANDIADDLQDIQDRLGKMEDSPQELEENVEAVAERLDRIEETVDGIDERFEAVLDRVDDLEDWQGDVAAAAQPDTGDDADD